MPTEEKPVELPVAGAAVLPPGPVVEPSPTRAHKSRLPSFLKDPRWWIDHSVDLLNLVATVILAVLIHHLDSVDKERDVVAQHTATDQLFQAQKLARVQASADSDIHQAFSLLTELQSRSTGHDVERRAIAAIVEQYAADGRLYEPATHIFIPLIQTECDEVTFQRLENAIHSAANVERRDATSEFDKDRDKLIRNKTQTELLSAIFTRTATCATQRPAAVASTVQNKAVDVSLGNFNVGCGEPLRNRIVVQLSSIVPIGYRIDTTPTADFKDTSNIKNAFASVTMNPDSLAVEYTLEGLDYQSFAFGIRNCPGGGHGTLILHVVLKALAAPPKG